MLIYILFVIGFVILIKGADMLVDGSASIARRLGMSQIMIGLTVVAFGTSLPEMIVNIIASFEGSTDIAIGNILGSNVANILLILGVSAIIYPITIKKNTTYREIPFSLLAAIVLGVLANDVLIDYAGASILSTSDGIILLAFFTIFMYYVASITKSEEVSEAVEEEMTLPRSVVFILIGIVGLAVGGKWIVEGAVDISMKVGLSEGFVGLTIVAIGTSLPELATSAMAAMKKKSDIAIGNVVGSNIFNIFWVLGISSIIKPLPFNTTSNEDIGMVILSSVLLFGFLFIGKRQEIQRWQGVMFLIMYGLYMVYLFQRG